MITEDSDAKVTKCFIFSEAEEGEEYDTWKEITYPTAELKQLKQESEERNKDYTFFDIFSKFQMAYSMGKVKSSLIANTNQENEITMLLITAGEWDEYRSDLESLKEHVAYSNERNEGYTFIEIFDGKKYSFIKVKNDNNPKDTDVKQEVSEDYFKLGKTYSESKNYEAAIENFSKAIELRTSAWSEDYNWRGMAYGKNGNYEAGIKDLTKAMELDNEEDDNKYYVDKYHWRGAFYCKSGNYNAAIEDLTKAIELRNMEDTYDRECIGGDYYWRARAYHEKSDNAAAMKDVEKALEMEPNLEEAKELKEILEGERK